MDRSKLRISKACQECRLRKIRCDGGEPCQRCQLRDVTCVYRKKARIRQKRGDGGGADGTVDGAGVGKLDPSSDQRQGSQQPQESREPQGLLPSLHTQQQQQQQQQQRPKNRAGSKQHPPGRGNLHNASVAATHRASPSVFLQLYYGPSSNFALLNAIYHKIEDSRTIATSTTSTSAGRDDGSGVAKEVEEIGPGLDLFNNRRLYFGDLADRTGGITDFAAAAAAPAMFLDIALAQRLLERYLSTYWLILPIGTRDGFRERVARLYGHASGGDDDDDDDGDAGAAAPQLDDPDTIIILLALALGASVLEEERVAQLLFRMAKTWTAAAALDDTVVNVQTVQISLLMSHFAAERARPNSAFLLAGAAVRKAVAAGLHKGVLGGAVPGVKMAQPAATDNGVGGSMAISDSTDDNHSKALQALEDARQMRITIWSVYFWETWLCFSLGRPSAFPEAEMDVPLPTDEKLLQAVVTLARVMSKSVARIYRRSPHDSLLPLWNAANDIRRELRLFAERQREVFNFGDSKGPHAGELGVCQTIVSTLYHHTLILTFRPFLVLRAKLRQEDAASHPRPPVWLDTACEYCLDAARHSIAFLVRAFETNELCRTIRYHCFFIEGASHVLAFDLLQNGAAPHANFPWIQLAIRALQLIMPRRKTKGSPLPVDLARNLERMIQSVYPDFRAAEVDTELTDGLPLDTSPLSTNNNTPGGSMIGLTQTSLGPSNGASNNDTRSGMYGTPIPTGISAPMVAGSPVSAAANLGASSDLLPSTLPAMQNVLSAPGAYLNPNSIGGLGNNLSSTTATHSPASPLFYPFTPFVGLDNTAGSSTQSPGVNSSGAGSLGDNVGTSGNPATDVKSDLTAADLGWNFDFGSMNMEAFLSIDPTMQMDMGFGR